MGQRPERTLRDFPRPLHTHGRYYTFFGPWVYVLFSYCRDPSGLSSTRQQPDIPYWWFHDHLRQPILGTLTRWPRTDPGYTNIPSGEQPYKELAHFRRFIVPQRLSLVLPGLYFPVSVGSAFSGPRLIYLEHCHSTHPTRTTIPSWPFHRFTSWNSSVDITSTTSFPVVPLGKTSPYPVLAITDLNPSSRPSPHLPAA